MLRSLHLIVFLAFSAAANAEDFDYNWLSFGYGIIEFDGTNIDDDAPGIDASFAFREDFHAFASYSAADLNFGIDAMRFDIGVGYNTRLSNVVDAWARLSYEYENFDNPGAGRNDDSGFGFGIGMRFAATERLELEGAVKYVDLSDRGDETTLQLGGLYSFTPAVAVGLFGEWGDDVTAYTLLCRLYWGQ